MTMITVRVNIFVLVCVSVCVCECVWVSVCVCVCDNDWWMNDEKGRPCCHVSAVPLPGFLF